MEETHYPLRAHSVEGGILVFLCLTFEANSGKYSVLIEQTNYTLAVLCLIVQLFLGLLAKCLFSLGFGLLRPQAQFI